MQKPSKPEFVRLRLREDILRGRFELGQPISERTIADELGVSRVPVREALIQLERDGLVEIVAGRGAQVRSFTASNIESLYQMREALEGMSARLAAERMPKKDLEPFRVKFEKILEGPRPTDSESISRLGDEFHRTFIRGSRNSMLIEANESIADLVHLARRLSYGHVEAERVDMATREHLEITEAIASGKPDLAERRVRKHISGWAAVVLETMSGDVNLRSFG
jgi:DNA-binding GntR family transcriptional regulator